MSFENAKAHWKEDQKTIYKNVAVLAFSVQKQVHYDTSYNKASNFTMKKRI